MTTDAPTLEDRLRLLESCVRGIVFEFDGDGRYLEVWTHDESLLARPRHELIGATIPEVLGLEGGRAFTEMIGRILAERQPQRLEYPLEVMGGPRWFAAEGFLGQRPGTVVLLIQDITERKQLEARMIESDRLAAIGLLAGGVGHEINNPLAWVMTQLSTLHAEVSARVEAGEGEPSARWSTQLSESLEGVERIRQIVRDLSFFTRSPETESSVVDLRRSLDWACDMAMAELRQRGRLTKVYADAPTVAAPEARLGQVFLNLLINAAQSISDDSAAANEVRVELMTDEAGHARVDIVDTGAGIVPEHGLRLFEPFFTTKPRGKGTGLGLSVSRRIVESIGGSLVLVSSRRGETRFRVTLPPAQAETSRPAQPASPVPASDLEVLIIDDHAGFLSSLRLALEPNLRVTSESSASAGLMRLRRGDRFDAVVCDLMMPDSTGMDLYDAVAAEAPALLPRLVFMTGGAFSTRARQFLLESVPNPRIEKPFRPEELLALLARLCQRIGRAVPEAEPKGHEGRMT